MPGILYNMPKAIAWDQGVAQGGATLTFSQTGTSTPQNVYTDIDLSVAHDIPVESDAEGVFPPIYLDPALPDYRVIFKDSAGVTIYTVDDIPAGVENAREFTVEGTAPAVVWTETDATSGKKNYRLIATGSQWLLQLGNDAKDTWATILTLTRTGNTADLINIAATALQLNGVSVATTITGSYTGTLTGCSTAPTGTIYYRITGGIVSLLYSGSTWFGTSNAVTMTVTGGPAAIRPTAGDSPIVPCIVYDNGTTTVDTGYAAVGLDGTINFGVNGSDTGFTGSGNKGIPEGWTITYPIGLV